MFPFGQIFYFFFTVVMLIIFARKEDPFLLFTNYFRAPFTLEILFASLSSPLHFELFLWEVWNAIMASTHVVQNRSWLWLVNLAIFTFSLVLPNSSKREARFFTDLNECLETPLTPLLAFWICKTHQSEGEGGLIRFPAPRMVAQKPLKHPLTRQSVLGTPILMLISWDELRLRMVIRDCPMSIHQYEEKRKKSESHKLLKLCPHTELSWHFLLLMFVQ